MKEEEMYMKLTVVCVLHLLCSAGPQTSLFILCQAEGTETELMVPRLCIDFMLASLSCHQGILSINSYSVKSFFYKGCGNFVDDFLARISQRTNGILGRKIFQKDHHMPRIMKDYIHPS